MRLFMLLLPLLACGESRPGGPFGGMEVCGNGLDDDDDSLIDCEDGDCLEHASCVEQLCFDGADDDDDGFVDCDDSDCWGLRVCRVGEVEVEGAVTIRTERSAREVRCDYLAGGGFGLSVTAKVQFSFEDFITTVEDRITGERCRWSLDGLVGSFRGSDRPYYTMSWSQTRWDATDIRTTRECEQAPWMVLPEWAQLGPGRHSGRDFDGWLLGAKYGWYVSGSGPRAKTFLWIGGEAELDHRVESTSPFDCAYPACDCLTIRSTAIWRGTVD